jgi:WD40 repeat protein
MLASGSSDGTIMFWDVRRSAILNTLDYTNGIAGKDLCVAHERHVSDMQFTPDGLSLLSIGIA